MFFAAFHDFYGVVFLVEQTQVFSLDMLSSGGFRWLGGAYITIHFELQIHLSCIFHSKIRYIMVQIEQLQLINSNNAYRTPRETSTNQYHLKSDQ